MMKVAIVDDKTDIVQMLRDVLEPEGIVAEGITDPREVRNICTTFAPDVYLIDLMLQHQCGIELAQELRDGGTVTPLIAMSGSMYMTELARETDLFDMVLDKPFDPDMLLVALTEAAAGEDAASLAALL